MSPGSKLQEPFYDGGVRTKQDLLCVLTYQPGAPGSVK